MANLDVYDFLILKEVSRTRSVTGAVEHVGLSQPSISTRLSHLRRHFNDPLFIRTSEGMMATPRLIDLMPELERALKLLSPQADNAAPFDPTVSDRTFRIGFSHVAQMVLFPQLLSALEERAPNIRIHSMDLDSDTAKLLEAGEIDLAVGFVLDFKHGFYQQRLFTERYACIARSDHPRIQSKLTSEQLLTEEFVTLIAPITGYSSLDTILEKSGIHRKIKIQVSSFLGLRQAIATTNLLAVVPARFAHSLAAEGGVQAFDMPVPTPSYEVRQFWHERFHLEPGNVWLRRTMFQSFLDMPDASQTELMHSNR